jgi:hypothetical protein
MLAVFSAQQGLAGDSGPLTFWDERRPPGEAIGSTGEDRQEDTLRFIKLRLSLSGLLADKGDRWRPYVNHARCLTVNAGRIRRPVFCKCAHKKQGSGAIAGNAEKQFDLECNICRSAIGKPTRNVRTKERIPNVRLKNCTI